MPRQTRMTKCAACRSGPLRIAFRHEGRRVRSAAFARVGGDKTRRFKPGFRNQQQGFDRGPPFLELLFGFGQPLDVSGCVLEGDELASARQRDGIVEGR
jgi:hypothetical protein